MCCLFGLYDYDNILTKRGKEKIIKVLSKEAEARGTDATGISYITNGKMTIYKRPLLAHKMNFNLKGDPAVIMGHTRLTTQGTQKVNANNHPFYSKELGFSLAHNGVLYNDETLRKSEKLPKTSIETDSYIAVQLIEQKNEVNFNSIKYMSEKVAGSFCFTVLDKNNDLYIVKGDNPMCLVDCGGFYLYASTDKILFSALEKLKIKNVPEIKMEPYSIFKISRTGSIEKTDFEPSEDYIFGKYSYGSFRKTYYNNSKPTRKRHNNSDFADKEYYEDIIDYAEFIGFDKEFVDGSLAEGWTLDDIAEMLYEYESYYDYGIYDLSTEI